MERLTVYIAFATLLVGIAAATDCYDCYYTSLTPADDNCNTATELHKVKNETCSGKCYTTLTVLHGSWYVGRGCDDDCEDGETGISKIPGVKTGVMTCCTGNHCNNEILSGSTIPRASVPFFAFCAAAAFFLLKLK